ncbi:MAG: succinylglutamate desuccinylase/aspartoacylase family protein [Acidobacteria bacterium]|nr:succinylglutamate desuccinylase/aspartoacylase family protein [Acidobacteriota bacterium]
MSKISFSRQINHKAARRAFSRFWPAILMIEILSHPLSLCAQERGSFTVGAVTAAVGTKASGWIVVPAGPDDTADGPVKIPVTVIHGSRPGPVLAIVAGTHGYEYSPIMAMQRLPGKVDARELAGTLIIVHVANPPSLMKRTIYYSPVDGKNLNRVYPGKSDGTQTERMAFAITNEVIEKADYVADIHCGDGNEALRPYAYWMTSGTEEVNEASKQLVLAFGLDHIVIDNDRERDPAKAAYTANTAITRGKPAITTETGGMGRIDTDGADLAEAGAMNLLRHLNMLPGDPNRVENPIWIEKNEVVRSPESGTFHYRVQPGQTVAKGTVLGVLTDFFGKDIAEIISPFAGEVLYVVQTPPVSKGEPVAMVGQIRKD